MDEFKLNLNYNKFQISKGILFSIIILLFNACDPGVTIDYQIQNKTNKSLIVKYRFMFSSDGKTAYKELSIPVNASIVIARDIDLGTI
jgi:hypothetical protein